VSVDERKKLQGKDISAADPNKKNLLQFVNSDNRTKLRYTQNMRRMEMKVKKHRKYLESQKEKK